MKKDIYETFMFLMFVVLFVPYIVLSIINLIYVKLDKFMFKAAKCVGAE